jgi:hypothetical protein
MADTMSIDNKLNPHDRDESDESIESPQDQDLDQNHSAPSAGHAHSAGNPVSQDGQQPKRKGGRKPVRQAFNFNFNSLSSHRVNGVARSPHAGNLL